jgi:hypothetical protein
MQVCKFLLSSYKFGDVCGTFFLLKKTRKMIRDVHIFLFFFHKWLVHIRNFNEILSSFCVQNMHTRPYVSLLWSYFAGIIRKTRTVMECLHRFCRDCIDKSMRLGYGPICYLSKMSCAIVIS